MPTYKLGNYALYLPNAKAIFKVLNSKRFYIYMYINLLAEIKFNYYSYNFVTLKIIKKHF